jgi:hypothetical protein
VIILSLLLFDYKPLAWVYLVMYFQVPLDNPVPDAAQGLCLATPEVHQSEEN